jgi:hypothetical protein
MESLNAAQLALFRRSTSSDNDFKKRHQKSRDSAADHGQRGEAAGAFEELLN